LPDEVVRLPKVSTAALAGDHAIARRRARELSKASSLSARHSTPAMMPFAFLTPLPAMTREEVPMFTFTTDRPTNAFANLEAQLRALGATGDRLAEATMSLRKSARIFAAASARVAGQGARVARRGRSNRLKLL